ncbi:putative conjugative transfer protein [Reticulomyxa filosa]|uniref:Putative conjugative transfer protein n=1 Tax=Reticulomyxa filosa TaxID=46433 RepID=X6PC32_RETFI|nr:putative conjugative transfer protein [Reticulomyxa filosa]|eukprot:ETO35232.1 putative conjugative transfer protein [Reticulomyxa filosa]
MELARGMKEIGYEIDFTREENNRWSFEVRGIDKEVREEYSQRRSDMLEKAEDLGIDSKDSVAMAHIATTTRAGKSYCSAEELKADWENRKGVDLSCVYKTMEAAKEKGLANEASDESAIYEALKYAIAHISESEAVFGKSDIIDAMIGKVIGRYGIEELEAAITEYQKNNILLKSENIAYTDQYTTLENLKLEEENIALMQAGHGESKVVMEEGEVLKLLAGSQLSYGQKQAVIMGLSTVDRVSGIQGSAGTGKTTAIKAMKELAGKAGYELLGTAQSKEAANIVAKETGIESKTLALFLTEYERVLQDRVTEPGMNNIKESLFRKIVVLDEASLVSSKDMNRLLKLSSKLDFKALLLGDVKQLGAIEAGKPFYYMIDHGLNTAEMDNIKRQASPSLREAVYTVKGAIDKDEHAVRKAFERSFELIGKS